MPRTLRTSTILLSAALTAGVVARPCFAQQPPDAGTAQTVQKDLAALAARLTDESARQDDRDEAARRLVSRPGPESHQILRNALEFGNRNAQLAAARALATDAQPDPALIPPLFQLLGNDRPLTEAAAQALAAYPNNPEVTTRLVNLAMARQQREPLRVAAIRALGSMADKGAAAALVGLMTRADENPDITGAAADALVDMTGLRDFGRNVQKWRQWWAANSAQSEADFRRSLLDSRAARLDQLQLRHRQLQEEVQSLLADQYRVAPDPQKADLLLRYLRSPEPSIRTTGAQLIFEDAVNNRTLPAESLTELRAMIGDSSPDVRAAVATALRSINDPEALEPLLTQLAQEPDESVRAAIARALATAGDTRALPSLRQLLNDPSFAVAEAAADAIREIGPRLRETDPQAAEATALELRGVLDRRAGEPGSQALRTASVMAMGALREPSLLNTFYALLRAREPSPVRRAAVKALGELREPQAADAIVNLLDDADATVRVEAVDALGKTGSFEHAEALYRHLRPGDEADESVRAQAWRVLESWFPSAPKEQLAQWADRFAGEPERRLIILQALAERQLKDGQEEGVAYTRQNIGETLVRLNRPVEAATYFRAALEYWNSRNDKGMVTVGLIQQLLTSLLRGKQYVEAAEFGGKLIASDLGQQQTVGPAFRSEAERLRDGANYSDALSLIEASRKMALDVRYRNDLSDIEAEIRKRLAEDQNRRISGPRSATMDFRPAPLPFLLA